MIFNLLETIMNKKSQIPSRYLVYLYNILNFPFIEVHNYDIIIWWQNT